MAKNRKHPTDTEYGIRPINVIESLRVDELTDDEVCKLFFMRFDANALIMAYYDRAGNGHYLGRLRRENAFQATSDLLFDVENKMLPFPGSLTFID